MLSEDEDDDDDEDSDFDEDMALGGGGKGDGSSCKSSSSSKESFKDTALKPTPPFFFIICSLNLCLSFSAVCVYSLVKTMRVKMEQTVSKTCRLTSKK